MSLKSKFASETYRARQSRGLTQERLAEAVGITPRALQYIESGTWLPKGETMLRLMILLHISADSFCEEMDMYDSLSFDEREPVHRKRS